MLVSAGFAGLLLVVVALFYLMPRRARCGGCGVARTDDSPLCRACGWIHDIDQDEEEDEGEAELILDDWQEGR